MGRKYTLGNTITGFTGPKTVFELGAAANTVVVIHAVSLTQATSEADDSTLITLGRYSATGTGTSRAGEFIPMDPGDAAFGGTAEDNHTSDITAGEVILLREGISLLAGFQKIWTPEMRPIIPGGDYFGLNVEAGITSVTLAYTVEFEEIG